MAAIVLTMPIRERQRRIVGIRRRFADVLAEEDLPEYRLKRNIIETVVLGWARSIYSNNSSRSHALASV